MTEEGSVKADILSVLCLGDPLSIIELADRLDEHPITVDEACSQLHKSGYIITIGGGRYSLTDNGYELLANDRNQDES
ncbi:helix-turn-helix domain-containing protein [Haladaptatus cibarius]|uniref:transcriptional regulator n=1 Tax=Haladaptatus cibarius TaxID=453847 RepID=UPI001185BC7E|nr:transcriptional regulator [Haladaptatus cibarius]